MASIRSRTASVWAPRQARNKAPWNLQGRASIGILWRVVHAVVWGFSVGVCRVWGLGLCFVITSFLPQSRVRRCSGLGFSRGEAASIWQSNLAVEQIQSPYMLQVPGAQRGFRGLGFCVSPTFSSPGI